MRPVLLSLAMLLACSAPDWNRKDAWQRCKPAIARWPRDHLPPCSALRMCANEAPLDEHEQRRLTEIMRSAGCAAP